MSKLSEQYKLALSCYLTSPNDTFLESARRLGDEAMDEGLDLAEIMSWHNRAWAQHRDRASEFLTAALFPMDMAVSESDAQETDKGKRVGEKIAEHQAAVAHLQNIFSKLADGVIVVDRQGSFVLFNAAAEPIVKAAMDAAFDPSGEFGFFHVDGKTRLSHEELPWIRAAVHNEEVNDQEIMMRSPSKPAGVLLSVSTRPNRDNKNRPNGGVVAFHDITAKKQTETALRQAVELQSDFVNFVTHQLRTPLTGIKWMLELVHKEKDVSPSVLELVQDAESASQRLILLVNELLDIARLEGGRFESGRSPIHLSTLTTSILQDLDPIIVANKHKVVFESTERSLDVVDADPQLLRQALMNLATNAFKYTPPGGNVHIAINKDPAGIRWSIKDSGIGIPKASQEKLFQKFFRASNATKLETEGTGLGLYMVRLILEKMHATISCTSEEGQGATFEVFFAVENKP